MTLIALPASLPQKVLRSNWNLSTDDPNRRTEMDDGAVASERRFARARTKVQIGWSLTEAQEAVFRSWWADDLAFGSKWFLAPYVVGLKETPTAARIFGDPPFQITSPRNGIFEVLFQVELKDLPRATSGERIALDLWITDPNGFAQAFGAIENLNTDLDGMSQWR